MAWKLTVRSGPRVQRDSFADLDSALEDLETRARDLVTTARARDVGVKLKRFDPSDQVLARLELAGPQRLIPAVRAGVDVRGDGSVQAFRGQIRRRALPAAAGETPYSALRRALS